MSDLTPPHIEKPKTNKIQLMVWTLGVLIVGAGAFVIGTGSVGDSPTTTTTTTINPYVSDMEEAVEKCNAEAFFEDEQIVFMLDEYSPSSHFLTMACVAEELMSNATYAQWGAASAMSGLQEVSENGLTFKFSYNGLADTSLLSVTLDD